MENKTERPIYENIPYIYDSQPMVETIWWAFLTDNKDCLTGFFLKDFIRWKPGFCVGVHVFPSSEQLWIYKTIYKHFWWCKYHKKLGL